MDKIIELVDRSIFEILNYTRNRKVKLKEQEDILMVLNMIKDDYDKNKNISDEILRGYKDVCTSTAIHFEDASYAESIFELLEFLENKYPHMKSLKLLGMDFYTLRRNH